MSIDQKVITKVMNLSRLKISQEEQDKMIGDLNKTLGFVAQLDEVDVTGVEPLLSVNDMALRARPDVVTDGGKTDDILANAPARTADFFTVPKVVE
jgi:aspartyl-tRNA(Asn)/glutamyl-tRNA(Gln) amidotransferase subunit C